MVSLKKLLAVTALGALMTEEQLRGKEPARTQALAKTTREDVPLLYWTMASWAGAISQRKTDLELVGDVPSVAAMLDRALALDEAYDLGALHEFAITFDPARPEGTTPRRQKEHLDRAMQLAQGEPRARERRGYSLGDLRVVDFQTQAE